MGGRKQDLSVLQSPSMTWAAGCASCHVPYTSHKVLALMYALPNEKNISQRLFAVLSAAAFLTACLISRHCEERLISFKFRNTKNRLQI